MIVGNTMALTIRERTREIGVLKTLGFSGRRMLGLVLGESVLLALLGGIPGLALAALLTFALRSSMSQFRAGLRGDARHRAWRHRPDAGARDRHRHHPGAQCHAAEDRHRARTGLTHALVAPAGRSRSRHQSEEHPQRLWLSLSTIVAVALVVIVLLAFLAMANGFQRTLAGSGSDDIAIVLRGGSQAEINSHGLARAGAADRGSAPASHAAPTASRWSRPSSIWWSTASSARARPRPTCRCAASASRARACARASRSRPAACSTAAATRSWSARGWRRSSPASSSARPSRSAPAGGPWSGMFEAGGSVFESEIWADLPVVQSLFNRPNFVQTVRVRLEQPGEPRGAQELQRRRSAPQARREIGSRLLRRPGVGRPPT